MQIYTDTIVAVFKTCHDTSVSLKVKINLVSVSAHGTLAKHLMHMAHLSGNTSVVSKLSSGDVCVAFFNVPPGNNNAVMPNPLTKEENCRVYNCRRALVRIN